MSEQPKVQSKITPEQSKPRPAELVTLPSYMDCHDHQYTQIVIGLKGQAEFEVRGRGNLVGPGQGCVVTACSDHAFGGVIGQSDILVLNMPLPSGDDPLMLQKINQLEQSHLYFQLDGQIQKLIQMLVREMQASPNDLLLSRACNDTVMALLQRHISAFETPKKSLALISTRLIVTSKVIWAIGSVSRNWRGAFFSARVSFITCSKNRWALPRISMCWVNASTWPKN